MSSSSKISIYSLLIELKNFLPRHFRVRLFWLIFLMVFSAFAEIISIGLIVPFLSAITNPSVIFESDMIQPVLSFFSVVSLRVIPSINRIVYNLQQIMFFTLILGLVIEIGIGLR